MERTAAIGIGASVAGHAALFALMWLIVISRHRRAADAAGDGGLLCRRGRADLRLAQSRRPPPPRPAAPELGPVEQARALARRPPARRPPPRPSPGAGPPQPRPAAAGRKQARAASGQVNRAPRPQPQSQQLRQRPAARRRHAAGAVMSAQAARQHRPGDPAPGPALRGPPGLSGARRRADRDSDHLAPQPRRLARRRGRASAGSAGSTTRIAAMRSASPISRSTPSSPARRCAACRRNSTTCRAAGAISP